MLRSASFAIAVSLLAASAAAAQTVPAPTAPAAAAPAVAAKLSTESTVEALMASEAAKAVLTKHVPHIVASPQLSLVMGMKFSELQQFAEAALTPELVKAIDADLAKL